MTSSPVRLSGKIAVLTGASRGLGKGSPSDSERPGRLSMSPVCKAGLHRLSADMAVELRDTGVAVVSVWPPASKTEGVLAQPDTFGDISAWEPPVFTGRVIAAFVAPDDVLARSGQALVVEDLAAELGIDSDRSEELPRR